MNRYDYKHNAGGIILIDNTNKKQIFLQPGDDSNLFLEQVEKTTGLFTIEMVIADYFDNNN